MFCCLCRRRVCGSLWGWILSGCSRVWALSQKLSNLRRPAGRRLWLLWRRVLTDEGRVPNRTAARLSWETLQKQYVRILTFWPGFIFISYASSNQKKNTVETQSSLICLSFTLPCFLSFLLLLSFGFVLSSGEDKCELCHSTCRTCSGERKENCSSCFPGKLFIFIMWQRNSGN